MIPQSRPLFTNPSQHVVKTAKPWRALAHEVAQRVGGVRAVEHGVAELVERLRRCRTAARAGRGLRATVRTETPTNSCLPHDSARKHCSAAAVHRAAGHFVLAQPTRQVQTLECELDRGRRAARVLPALVAEPLQHLRQTRAPGPTRLSRSLAETNSPVSTVAPSSKRAINPLKSVFPSFERNVSATARRNRCTSTSRSRPSSLTSNSTLP